MNNDRYVKRHDRLSEQTLGLSPRVYREISEWNKSTQDLKMEFNKDNTEESPKWNDAENEKSPNWIQSLIESFTKEWTTGW